MSEWIVNISDGVPSMIKRMTPLVRCKDCKHGRPYKHTREYVACDVDVEPVDRDKDFFCADGERRNE